MVPRVPRRQVNVSVPLGGKEFVVIARATHNITERIALNDATVRTMVFVIQLMVSVLARPAGPESGVTRSVNRDGLGRIVHRAVIAVWSTAMLVTQLLENVSANRIGVVFAVKADVR